MGYIIIIYLARVKQKLSYAEEKMAKNFLMIMLVLVLAFPAQAKKGLNIFAYSRPAPETPVYNAYGKSIKLRDFSGDFLLVVFWSRYCAPCIRELDELNAFENSDKREHIERCIAHLFVTFMRDSRFTCEDGPWVIEGCGETEQKEENQ